MPTTEWDLREEMIKIGHQIYRAINICNILGDVPATKEKLEALRLTSDAILDDLYRKRELHLNTELRGDIMLKITNQRDLRKAFWRDFANHPTVIRKRLNNGDYPTDTRCAWVDYIDCMCREGHISEALADRATLN